MNIRVVLKVLGLILMIFSFNLLPVILVELIYQENQITYLLYSLAITLIAGFVIWLFFRSCNKEFRIRESVLLVVLCWLSLSLFASLPFLLSPTFNISITDAFFEAMSALTTTGATIFSNLDSYPKSILYYRCQLQWVGGMGIIVFFVSIFPLLGIGGMGMYKAEYSSISEDKIKPKIAQTANILWRIYIIFTIFCAGAYYIGGMSLFDAISHSFSTIAIGGFSTHDDSIGYFNSPTIEMIAVVFMILSGINFSLHFFAFQKKSFAVYLKNSELKAYLLLLLLLIVVVFSIMLTREYFDSVWDNIRSTVFHTVSIATTTGFISEKFYNWPVGVPIILILTSFVGACASSTGGGIKVVRILLMFKLGMREIRKLIHPRVQINIKLNNKTLDDNTLTSVWGFFALYVMSFVVIFILLLITGLDGITAFSATTASINNLGPGLGDVAFHYQSINDAAKWILSFSMLLGRLEILTLIALLHKSFWKY